MKRVLFVICLLLNSINLNATFFISSKPSCSNGDYSFNISSSSLFADINVFVGKETFLIRIPDVKISFTDDPDEADLVLIDDKFLNYNSKRLVDMSVCKGSNYLGNSKTIEITQSFNYNTDISVQIIDNSAPILTPSGKADYKMFFKSDVFTEIEAAGLFPAIWELNKK